MKEHPMLFSGAMVRAILDGLKKQTRRVVDIKKFGVNETHESRGAFRRDGNLWKSSAGRFNVWSDPIPCPYGASGDRLWVKETFALHSDCSGYGCVCYRASCPDGSREMICEDEGNGDPIGIGKEVELSEMHPPLWKPSIFMPRWASRITLEIVSVRVERLQEISEADAIAEGVERLKRPGFWKAYNCKEGFCATAARSYETLWNEINGPGSADANPWVWVVEFKKP